MTKDLALLVGPGQPHQTARLFGKYGPERVPPRAVIDVRSRDWNRERDRTRGILNRA